VNINIVDCDIPHLRSVIPSRTIDFFNNKMVSPILTRKGAFTALHYDPPINGSGWMYLAKGIKQWILSFFILH
jgi:hypothetical protein